MMSNRRVIESSERKHRERWQRQSTDITAKSNENESNAPTNKEWQVTDNNWEKWDGERKHHERWQTQSTDRKVSNKNESNAPTNKSPFASNRYIYRIQGVVWILSLSRSGCSVTVMNGADPWRANSLAWTAPSVSSRWWYDGEVTFRREIVMVSIGMERTWRGMGQLKDWVMK